MILARASTSRWLAAARDRIRQRRSERQARRERARRQRHRWAIYRISYADGAAYVGQTSRAVAKRVEEHIAKTPAIKRRSDLGLHAHVEVLAEGLTRRQALARERREIGRLRRPLNVAGPTRRWKDPITSRSPRRQQRAVELVVKAEARAAEDGRRAAARRGAREIAQESTSPDSTSAWGQRHADPDQADS